MRSELIQITPSLAEHFLSKNRVNRTISHHKVAQYADLMQRGKWSLTHQGIAFYEDDSVADGQHRLLAIIKARATVPMMVTYGLEKESSLAIDYHRPRRIIDGIIGSPRYLARLNSSGLCGKFCKTCDRRCWRWSCTLSVLRWPN